MSIKWKMIDSNNFTAEKEGFVINIKTEWRKSPRWDITKNNVVLDQYCFHSPTNGELSAKVQSEKALDVIMERWNKSVEEHHKIIVEDIKEGHHIITVDDTKKEHHIITVDDTKAEAVIDPNPEN